MKIKINTIDTKNILINIMLLIPFFELQSFEMFADLGISPVFFNIILQIFSLLRLIITMFLFIDILRKNKLKISSILVCTILFVLLEDIVSFVNGSLYFNYFVGSFTFIGFIIMCSYMIKKSEYQFITACKNLFGILSVLGALQTIIMPFGFLNATDKAFSIYLLGSKNSSFFYYIIYLFFAFYQDIQKNNKIMLKHIMTEVLFIFAAIYSNSMNTLVMLMLLFMFSIVFNYGKKIYYLISPRRILVLVFMIAFVILIPEIRKVLKPILQILGRNTSFTGRDVLWEQAIYCFLKRPLFGTGIHTKFRLKTGVLADDAHSQFLDLLAKYGIIVFIIYMLIPICAMYGATKHNKDDKRFIALKSIVVFVILFHSVLDHMPFYHFLLVMAVVESLSTISYEKSIKSFRSIYNG